MSTPRISRRHALKAAAAGLAAPFVFRRGVAAAAAPSDTLQHVSVGAGGRAAADIGELTASPHLKLIAVADVDSGAAAALKLTISRDPDLRRLARDVR